VESEDPQFAGGRPATEGAQASSLEDLFTRLVSSPAGLTTAEAARRAEVATLTYLALVELVKRRLIKRLLGRPGPFEILLAGRDLS